jgi:uncharacterized FlaG/YvyC family protein
MDAISRGASATSLAPQPPVSVAVASAPAGGSGSQPGQPAAPQEPTQSLVERANSIAQASQLQVRFSLDANDQTKITILSPVDGSVIRQIPETSLRDMMKRVTDTLGGLMVNQLV